MSSFTIFVINILPNYIRLFLIFNACANIVVAHSEEEKKCVCSTCLHCLTKEQLKYTGTSNHQWNGHIQQTHFVNCY